MAGLYLSMNGDTDRVVRSPRVTDAIGAALRGVFDCPALPDDMTRLLHALNRPR